VKAAELARALGEERRAEELAAQAAELKRRFNQAFWQERLGMYAIALDGHKRPCEVRSSNAGHCLFSGIAEKHLARTVRDELLGRAMFSGWGIRTIGSGEPRYNPMSYHNGSIWPHDNALIAAGFARYGFREAAERVFRAWFDSSRYLELHRLPELCCGFRRREGKGPTLYPVACSPQAWAAGAVFMMLGAMLGIRIDGLKRAVLVHRPCIPKPVREIRLRGLRIGDSSMDLLFHRNQRDVGVLVLRKEGPVDVVVTK
jgi:glycogen debranching enzyme